MIGILLCTLLISKSTDVLTNRLLPYSIQGTALTQVKQVINKLVSCIPAGISVLPSLSVPRLGISSDKIVS